MQAIICMTLPPTDCKAARRGVMLFQKNQSKAKQQTTTECLACLPTVVAHMIEKSGERQTDGRTDGWSDNTCKYVHVHISFVVATSY